MTIFRSKPADFIAQGLAIIGLLGFFICGGINFAAQGRLLGHHEFDRPSPSRPAPIGLKGATFYVESSYARRYKLADRWNLYFWLMLMAGVLYGNRKIIMSKFRPEARRNSAE